jgi:SNF2 family DNA or RNA helicase
MASNASSEASLSHTSTPAPHHMSTDDAGTPTGSSETSHSSSGDRSQSKPSFYQSGLSTEAHASLSDLSKYMALGCLTYQDVPDNTFTLGLDYDSPRWQDLPLTAPGFPPEPNLMKLTTAGWIRVQVGQSTRDWRYTIYRLYILPGDVGLRFIDRENRRLLAALERLVATIDVSPETWSGRYTDAVEVGFDAWATRDEGSLFYMFNKLPSPRPDPTLVKERYAREAVEDLLDPSPASALVGLKTPLYPYQRRSAALMLQRESVSTLMLDPRFEPRTAPDGSSFFFGPRELLFHRNPRYYEATRGGILTESMGLGKTLICLSLILATRNHPPQMPPAYALPLVRTETASLAQMTVSAINRKSVPWKVEFERIGGMEMSSCAQMLNNTPPEYEIPVEPARWNRRTVIPPPQRKTLAATTILVVPRNLCKQWHSEIQKHVDESVLRILLMEEPRSVLPAADELRGYDVIIFSRTRFESEVKDGADDRGRRLLSRPSCKCPYVGAIRTVDCHCVKADDIYESPLKQLHFKRLIIDEGHFFSSSDSLAVRVAKSLVTADHRWVVSGTPAKDLLGVESDMSVAQNAVQEEAGESRDEVLDRRRHFNFNEDTSGAIKSLGTLASHFLRIQPWAAEGSGERPAIWEDHIYRHEDHRRRTFSGFSSCLRRTLEAMVVKTQPEDVEQDIKLPPLNHEVIRLEPSYYDKMTVNLFSIVLTANAVTSERKDVDYLFHKNSAQARYQLIGNLRQSAFFWTGFSEEDIIASQKNSKGYLEKPTATCTDDDRRLLTEALQATDSILSSEGWKALSRSHELGVFVDRWPEESAAFWAFGGTSNPLLTGISQLLEAQKHVNERVGLEDPGEGLAGIGIKAMKRAEEGRREDQVAKRSKPTLAKANISLSGEPTLKRRASSSSRREKSTAKRAKTSKNGRKESAVVAGPSSGDEPGGKSDNDVPVKADTTANRPGRPAKRRWSDVERSELSSDSHFSEGLIIGTTSAKLSYLTSQILKHHREEKILVFYEGDNIAYYIAQMLELLHIKHEIYAKSLASALKSEYVVRFNEEPQERVLLMDVKHAAHGLNISSASRIYFVNPVCRPDVEAQAIKRAHRIGQTRPVFVQTLLLSGSIEEKMYERAKRMTSVEHHVVTHLEDDDGMREIIQGAGLMSVSENESSGAGQMAPLEVPQRLWARPGWRDTLSKSNFSSDKLTPDAGQSVSSKRRKGKEKEKAKGKKSVQLATAPPPPPPPLPHRAASPIVSVPRPDSAQQIATTTETAIPTASGSASNRQPGDDGDDEPMVDRWRLLPQASR